MQVAIRVTNVYEDGTTTVFECTAENIAEAIAAANQLAGNEAPAPAAKEAPKADLKKSDAKTASSKSGAEPPTTALKASAPVTDKLPGVSYDEVKEALLELATARGRDVVLAVLQRFGVAKGTALKVEQYGDVLAMFKGTLDGSVDPTKSMNDDLG